MKKLLLIIALLVTMLSCQKTGCYMCTTTEEGITLQRPICDVTKEEIIQIEKDLNYTYYEMVIFDSIITVDSFGFYFIHRYTGERKFINCVYWNGDTTEYPFTAMTEWKIKRTVKYLKQPEDIIVTSTCEY